MPRKARKAASSVFREPTYEIVIRKYAYTLKILYLVNLYNQLGEYKAKNLQNQCYGRPIFQQWSLKGCVDCDYILLQLLIV